MPIAEEIVRLGRRYEWWGDRQDRWRRRWLVVNYTLGAVAAVVAGIAGTSLLGSDADNQLAGVLALVSAGLGGLLTFLNPAERAGRASERATDSWEVAMLARYQLASEIPHMGIEDAKGLLREIQDRERTAVKTGGRR